MPFIFVSAGKRQSPTNEEDCDLAIIGLSWSSISENGITHTADHFKAGFCFLIEQTFAYKAMIAI